MVYVLIVACLGEKQEAVEEVEEDKYPHDVAQSCHAEVLEWNDSWMGIEFATLDEINRRRAEPAGVAAASSSSGEDEPNPR